MEIRIDRDAVLAIFRSNPDQPLKVREVGRFLEVEADRRAALRAMLRVLVEEGELEAVSGRRFALPGGGTLVEGKVKLHRGFGWLLVEGAREDAYLSADEIAGLCNGDRVRARLGRAPKGPIAQVVKVLSRGQSLVTGVLRRSGSAAWVEAAPEIMAAPIRIVDEEDDDEGPRFLRADDGHVVEVSVLQHPTQVTSAVGRIVRVLGRVGDLSVEVERLLAESSIPRIFAPEAVAEADAFGETPTDADMAGREDLRPLPLCTIDGETAKDFDDAVCARKDGPDILVTVAIADVSHYVTPGSALDEEARRRGTSVYFPGAVVPMLPEVLSNGLCSLKPQVERLCMAVEMRLGKTGKIKRTRFLEGRMWSHARLTYTQVAKFFEQDEEVRAKIPSNVQESLRLLAQVAGVFRKKRMARGAMDFDLPESVIQLDDTGLPVSIHPQDRNDAHKLIEELMLAANEAVAEKFFRKEMPCIYRIHEPPDAEKLEKFHRLAGYVTQTSGNRENPGSKGRTRDEGARKRSGAPVAPTAKELTARMQELEGSPLSTPLSFLLLRAMMQAKYAADNLGHFSLASEAYLHFTSPIRRYPDLMVHRLLKNHLRRPRRLQEERTREREFSRLDQIADECSQAERRATEVERNMDALFQAWFMRDKIGERFVGVITGCAEFGVFVRVQTHHVEGMVHVATIGKDYLDFDDMRMRLYSAQSGFSVGVGDEVEVEVSSVDISKRQVGLLLVKITKQMGRDINIELRAADRESEERRVGYEERRSAWLAQQSTRGGERGSRGGQQKRGASSRYGRSNDGDEGTRRGRSAKSKGAKKGRRGQGRTKRR